MAWVPRNLNTMPAFTTNVEWGMYWDSGRIVLGAPEGAPKNEYLQWYAQFGGVPTAVTLADTVSQAMELLNRLTNRADSCVFCEIVQRDPKGQIERHTPHAVVFTPLSPVIPGHKLVVSRAHVGSALENAGVTADTIRDAVQYAAKYGDQMNLITSVGKDATQTVRHLHIHIVPRHAGDGLALPWTGQH